jgi:hypothetical protein
LHNLLGEVEEGNGNYLEAARELQRAAQMWKGQRKSSTPETLDRGALKQRVHGVVDLYGTHKPSFDALRSESSPVKQLLGCHRRDERQAAGLHAGGIYLALDCSRLRRAAHGEA